MQGAPSPVYGQGYSMQHGHLEQVMTEGATSHLKMTIKGLDQAIDEKVQINLKYRLSSITFNYFSRRLITVKSIYHRTTHVDDHPTTT